MMAGRGLRGRKGEAGRRQWFGNRKRVQSPRCTNRPAPARSHGGAQDHGVPRGRARADRGGRRLDLSGFEAEVGRLCAQALDFRPTKGGRWCRRSRRCSPRSTGPVPLSRAGILNHRALLSVFARQKAAPCIRSPSISSWASRHSPRCWRSSGSPRAARGILRDCPARRRREKARFGRDAGTRCAKARAPRSLRRARAPSAHWRRQRCGDRLARARGARDVRRLVPLAALCFLLLAAHPAFAQSLASISARPTGRR